MPSLEPDNPKIEDGEEAEIRTRLAGAQGQQFWRCLEELMDAPTFREKLQREFPRQASALNPALSRREMLLLLGASFTLAGLSGCAPRQPQETIVPYINQPDNMVPGKPLQYATAMTLGGYAQGLLATSREGRPIKMEGNPDHPASLGRTDVFMQAVLLSLYDPDRSQSVLSLGQPDTWDAFMQALTTQMDRQRASGGAGMRLLTGTVTSPTLAAQMRALLAQFPAARWHRHDPLGRDNVYAGARMAFGTDLNTVYRFDKAEVILSLDGDFLQMLPGHIRYARDFAERRRVRHNTTTMNRLYAVESTPTLTGAMADHRQSVRPGDVLPIAVSIAQMLRTPGVEPGSVSLPAGWIALLARDLQSHPGTSLVVPGDHQPPVVHALAHAMNAQLGNVGKTVFYTDPIEADRLASATPMEELTREMQAGQVEMLLILGTNPVYSAPADLAFADALARVPFSVHLGMYADETGALCQWHIPESHFLESWSDARAYDGTATILQPLIAPFYATRSVHELMAALAMQPNRSGHDIIRDNWQRQNGTRDFETFWRQSLHDGVVPGSAAPERLATLRPSVGTDIAAALARNGSAPASSLELRFVPDPCVWDGTFANNGWLQELPKPLSKLTWDNAALLSPQTAQKHGLANEEVVELLYGGRTLRAPVWIMPGHPDDSVTLTLGYGRTRAGHVGNGAGCNAYALRTSDAPWFGSGLEIRKTGNHYPLAVTHTHHTMEGRDLMHQATLEEFLKNPHFVQDEESAPERPPSILPEWKYDGPAWGMAIDNNVCIGCNACVTACQAENNIPIVGKEEVRRGREMHWLRIDRYYTGKDMEKPAGTYFQPIPCMHCENAPCELVCPVGATVHDSEGLNEMVYNRCIGTRYCSNNCPYKVRRFNFYHYAAGKPNPEALNGNYDNTLIRLMANPEVTIRSRGVMEKCTYCVQRIQNAKIEAEKENRTVQDGEIKTACQQSCPTDAIVFGNIADPNSAVAQWKAEPHHYSLLTELNTRPRTSYLARFQNPNLETESE